jgi:sugar transferase (PEP-CTERM/EpsH1 system associated)
MRLLCLTARLPFPPNRGDRLRAFQLIRRFSREHEVTLASFVASESETRHVEELERSCSQVHTVVLPVWRSVASSAAATWSRHPLQSAYYRSRRMNRLVLELLASQRFDAAYVHLFRMAAYLENRTELYRILDLTDVISREIGQSLEYRGPLWRTIYRLELPRLQRYERQVSRSFDENWVVSPADARALARLQPEARIQVVPNGVDLKRFAPSDRPGRSNAIMLVGHMGVFHNVDAARVLAREILPRVRRHVPDCSLFLVGASPSPAIRRLGRIHGVTVTGFRADLSQVLNQAAVFAAPLRFAAGIQNKVLEAMAAGLPVVTTSVVNAGIQARSGAELIVADEPDEAARQIVGLLKDPLRRQSMGAAAREYVANHFSWTTALDRLRAVEKTLRMSRSGPRPAAEAR